MLQQFMLVLFKALAVLEKILAYFQGKGYGSASIRSEVNSVLRLLNDKPSIAIDVGGNIGDYSNELLRRVPGLELHIFEPAAVNFDHLRSRFSNLANVRLSNSALSSSTGKATLYADVLGSGMASLTKRDVRHVGLSFEAHQQVTTIRFEDYWRDNLGSRPIDIVKLDVEGHELDVLKGFGNALKAISVLQFEFGGCNIDTRTTWRDFFYLLTGAGFSIFRITPLGAQEIRLYREADEFYSTTNYIGVRVRSSSS